MKDQTIYAVVDIETTGTSTVKDKIIQFACVLVQNGKIINHFSTDVNPLQSIPKNIENLTGITNQQVANAPYFEDIAPIIKELLTDCVFVAHNVYFDFSFLNSELTRSGEIELTISCIDTVELAQILYPQASGFRVTDLAAHFDLTHDNPHQALSDAYVTAEIFIQLIKKVDQIPYVTLTKMTELAGFLGVDNDLIFKKALFKKESNPLNQLLDYVKTIDMITLKIKDYSFKENDYKETLEYPKGELLKELITESGLDYRQEQKQMMDEIYDFMDENLKKNLLVESSTGTGKSLGYLLPISYLNKRPITVSTSTIMLQEQLLISTIPQLEKIIGKKVNGVILKSNRHFIDLEKFYKTLQNKPSQQKQYIINQMAVLNWLRETETGDLDELNLNKKHIFFEHICHHGLQTLNKSSLFYEEDFLRYLESKKSTADIFIVNHSFLCEETNRDIKLLPKSEVLVVDEAHKLIHSLEEKNMSYLSFKYLYQLFRKIKEIEELSNYLDDEYDLKLKKSMELLSLLSVEAREDIQWLETFLMQLGKLSEQHPECNLNNLNQINEWPTAMKKNMKEIQIIFREINQLIDEVLRELALKNKNLADSQEYFLFLEYVNTLQALRDLSQRFILFFKNDNRELTQLISIEKQHLLLKEINFKQISIQETSWYDTFRKIIYTSGTLQLNINSDYFEKQLNLPTPKKIVLSERYSYEDNAELIVIKDYEKSDFGNEKEYVHFISQSITQIYQVRKGAMLVLFTSHRILKKVYQDLSHRIKAEETEIFAQGVTGTKEKIIKRFIKNNGGIILGANSFWEGVDVNLPKLDIIIMTKLPFDPPNRPLIEAKYRYLEKVGQNPFYDEAIPQAGSRLRQGIGRLIRTDTDKGIVVMLDYRLLQSSYSKELLNYLPEDLDIKNYFLKDALREIKSFFTEK